MHEGATLLADSFVRNTQLPVVLDLDETLLVANSLSQLESQMAKAKEGRYSPIHKRGSDFLPAALHEVRHSSCNVLPQAVSPCALYTSGVCMVITLRACVPISHGHVPHTCKSSCVG